MTFAFVVMTGFVFATPDPTFKNNLIRDQIAQIKASNEKSASSLGSGAVDVTHAGATGVFGVNSVVNVVFAQEEGGGDENPGDQGGGDTGGDTGGDGGSTCDQSTGTGCTLICCSRGETANGDEYCDDLSQCQPMCCGSTSGQPNIGWRCDASLCGGDCNDDNSCTPTDICCDVNADNYTMPGTIPNTSCNNTAVCTYSYNDICCDDTAGNYITPGQRAPNDRCNILTCTYGYTYCCDGNWDNYTQPSQRSDPHTCEYGAGACFNMVCPNDQYANYDSGPYAPEDPGKYPSESVCSNGSLCQIDTTFSTIKSGVSIAGNAQMLVSAPCGSDEDNAFVAGLASAAATPSTPLNTPVELDAFTTYTVTSKDYCLNVNGVQSSSSGYNRDSEGFCCESPTVVQIATSTEGVLEKSCETPPPVASCGSAAAYPTEDAPTSNLCSNGNPSTVTSTTNAYNWTCNITGPTSTANCSVTKTCNGQSCAATCTDLDCGPSDVCANVVGSQTTGDLVGLNMTPYGNRECHNSSSGSCGSLTYASYTTTNLTSSSANLCASGAFVSAGPTLAPASGATPPTWSWTCATTNGGDITPPTCSVKKCVGAQCSTTQTAGLIKTFKAEPAIVSSSDKECVVTWESNGIDSSITEPLQGCKLNGNNVASTTLSGISVSPGPYTLMCFIGDQFETKSIKCSVKPDYKEI